MESGTIRKNAGAPLNGSPIRGGSTTPLVSIGLPVYNGEAYLESALASIRAQTFQHFELIISDNASTDRTEQIARAFAKNNPGTRYERQPVNIGGDRNYNRCVELATGDYYLGLAHDDELHPEYLARCLEILERDPSIVFCHSWALRLDQNGTVTGEFERHAFSTSDQPHERLHDAVCDAIDVISSLGVTRLSVLRELPPFPAYPSGDVYRQAQLALRGKLHVIPDHLFRRRVHPKSGGRIPLYERIAWSKPEHPNAIYFPNWRRLAEYIRAVASAPVSSRERLRCYAVLWAYCRKRRVFHQLARDLRMAVRQLLVRTSAGRRIQQTLRRQS